MVSYHRLSASNGLVTCLFAALNDAEEARLFETAACARIQSVFRMVSQRRKYLRAKHACIHIQRVYRGYRGRVHALLRRIDQHEAHAHLFYTHFAVLIQKTFRGFFSRKWRSNYYQQKAYLKVVEERSQQVMKSIAEHQMESLEAEERRKQTDLLAAFAATTKDLHHLVSTQAIPGVFRDPLSGMSKQTVFDGRIEDTLIALKAPVKKHKAADLFPTNTLGCTLQASSRYDIVKTARQMETKLDKLTRLDHRELRNLKENQFKRFVPGNSSSHSAALRTVTGISPLAATK